MMLSKIANSKNKSTNTSCCHIHMYVSQHEPSINRGTYSQIKPFSFPYKGQENGDREREGEKIQTDKYMYPQ